MAEVGMSMPRSESSVFTSADDVVSTAGESDNVVVVGYVPAMSGKGVLEVFQTLWLSMDLARVSA